MDVNNCSEGENPLNTNGSDTIYAANYNRCDDEGDDEGDEEATTSTTTTAATTTTEETDELNDEEITKVFTGQSAYPAKFATIEGRNKCLQNPAIKNFRTARSRASVALMEGLNSESESVGSSPRTSSSQASMSPVVSDVDDEDGDEEDDMKEELIKRACLRKMLRRDEAGGSDNKIMDMINLSPDNQVTYFELRGLNDVRLTFQHLKFSSEKKTEGCGVERDEMSQYEALAGTPQSIETLEANFNAIVNDMEQQQTGNDASQDGNTFFLNESFFFYNILGILLLTCDV
jgi:hypothetical protein